MYCSNWLQLKGIVLGSSLRKSVDSVLSNITGSLSLLAVVSFALALVLAGHSPRETESHQQLQASTLPAQHLWMFTPASLDVHPSSSVAPANACPC